MTCGKSAEAIVSRDQENKGEGVPSHAVGPFGRGWKSGGVRNFGELTAAVEASESMEDAITMIESQNDAMEERRRMGVVASQAAASEMPRRRRRGGIAAVAWDPSRTIERGRRLPELLEWRGPGRK